SQTQKPHSAALSSLPCLLRAIRGCEEIESGRDCERDEARCEAGRRGDAETSRRRRNEADGLVPPQYRLLWIFSQPLSPNQVRSYACTPRTREGVNSKREATARSPEQRRSRRTGSPPAVKTAACA